MRENKNLHHNSFFSVHFFCLENNYFTQNCVTTNFFLTNLECKVTRGPHILYRLFSVLGSLLSHSDSCFTTCMSRNCY